MQTLGQLSSNGLNAVNPVNGVEILVAATPPVIPNKDGQTVLLIGSFELTVNAITSYQLNLRRGPLVTSTLILGGTNIAFAGVAAQVAVFNVAFSDFLIGSGPLQYSMTYLQIGANGASFNATLAA